MTLRRFSLQLDDRLNPTRKEDLEIIAARVPGRSIAEVIKSYLDLGIRMADPITDEERDRYRSRQQPDCTLPQSHGLLSERSKEMLKEQLQEKGCGEDGRLRNPRTTLTRAAPRRPAGLRLTTRARGRATPGLKTG